MEEFVAAVFDDEYARRIPPKSSLPPPRLLLLLLLLLALDDDKGEVVFEGLVEEVAGMTPHALREEKDVAQSVVIFNEKKKPLRERETFLGYHLIMKVEGHYLLFLPVCFESINITRAARTHKHIFSCL